jgi:hypothetical protein
MKMHKEIDGDGNQIKPEIYEEIMHHLKKIKIVLKDGTKYIVFFCGTLYNTRRNLKKEIFSVSARNFDIL